MDRTFKIALAILLFNIAFAIYHIANGKYSIITEEACDIAICDIAGRVIKKFKAIPMFDNELNLSERGIYIVKVGTSAEKLIVK